MEFAIGDSVIITSGNFYGIKGRVALTRGELVVVEHAPLTAGSNNILKVIHQDFLTIYPHSELPRDTYYLVVLKNGQKMRITSAEAAANHEKRWPGSRVAVMECTHWLDEAEDYDGSIRTS